jgi:hypothetical protein
MRETAVAVARAIWLRDESKYPVLYAFGREDDTEHRLHFGGGDGKPERESLRIIVSEDDHGAITARVS